MGIVFLLIPCETSFFRQTFEMTPPKERHPADREWVGGAAPFLFAFPGRICDKGRGKHRG